MPAAGGHACALPHAPWATVASMIPTSQPQPQPSDNINAIIADVLSKPKVRAQNERIVKTRSSREENVSCTSCLSNALLDRSQQAGLLIPISALLTMHVAGAGQAAYRAEAGHRESDGGGQQGATPAQVRAASAAAYRPAFHSWSETQLKSIPFTMPTWLCLISKVLGSRQSHTLASWPPSAPQFLQQNHDCIGVWSVSAVVHLCQEAVLPYRRPWGELATHGLGELTERMTRLHWV